VPITDADSQLYDRARAASANAHAPYSEFPVGAALQLRSGEVVTGVNVENGSYGLTSCAERNAVFTAVGSGQREFEAIAVHAEAASAPPCGACRQVLAEFAPEIRVIWRREGKLVATPLSELLPDRFVL
jgi:cytidine deaminase